LNTRRHFGPNKYGVAVCAYLRGDHLFVIGVELFNRIEVVEYLFSTLGCNKRHYVILVVIVIAEDCVGRHAKQAGQ
jgi:hypothetical protein